MRKAALALFLGALIFGLCGCSAPFSGAYLEGAAELPVPPDTAAPQAPYGDGRADYDERVQLHYLSADGGRLVPLTRTFWLTGDEDPIERILEALLSAPGRDELRAIVPAGTRLLSAERAGDVVVVNLSGEALTLTEKERAFAAEAVANTLTGLGDVAYVNVLIDGQAIEGMPPLPLGARERGDSNLTALWAQMDADRARLLNGGAPELLAVLYFGGKDGEWLLPEVRRVRFEGEDFIMPLLRELSKGPSVGEGQEVLPADLEPLMGAPGIGVSATGRRLITLPFKQSFIDEIQRRGTSMRQFYGALTLTLARFVPEVDGIIVRADGEKVERVLDRYGDIAFADGVMMPADFESMVGEVVRIYLARGDGLVRVPRVLDPYSARSPRTLLEQLMVSLEGEDATSPIPGGISGADFLGVRQEGDVALVNLSSNFYRCCQSLDEARERQLIYSMVNTLCTLPGIDRVRFYVDGQLADTLVREIYIRGELIPNPGIVLD